LGNIEFNLIGTAQTDYDFKSIKIASRFVRNKPNVT